ncbi:putative ATPase-related protein [Campylobacter iguaniorum]|uniref:AtpZ/AtpI family protein n=1 Tax=Campylobacter iguaniorum TaxID=1244531 RepID=UPI00073A3A89|nr:AtpZ/AtpI family protein [Campylobacter iguaniorum]ALV24879.1 putative ATPase-related protein [Campylobacter iguaniorum]ANE36186.1 putative ATPase-related protein [Campylobacter iguaniorum]
MSEEKSSRAKKINTTIKAADNLSLGISMVVAVAIGFGIGYGLKSLTGSNWGLGVGIFIGVAAAFNNVYKAYKSQVKSYEEFKDQKPLKTKDDDDEI